MSVLKKLAGQTAIYGVSSVLGRILNWLLVPLYTRIFMEAEYGIVTELYAYAGLFYVLFTYGLETAFFRYSEKHNHDKKVFSTANFSLLASSIALGAVFLIFSPDFAQGLGYPEHTSYVQMFVLILAFDALAAIPFARLRAENRPMRFAAIKLTNIGINIGLNLFFLVLCPMILTGGVHSELDQFIDKIYSREFGVGYIFLSNLVASFVTLLLLSPSYKDLRFGFDGRIWRSMMRYGLPLVLVGLAAIINENLDKILLKFLLDGTQKEVQAQIGVYGACYKLSVLMTIFTQAYRYAAEPFFFSEAKKEDAKSSYALVMKYFVIVGSLIFLGVMFYMPILKYFIGEKFHDGLFVVPILLIANLFLGIFYNLSVWYKLTDKTMLGGYISIFGGVVTVILNLILIPIMGYEGSAWATLACYFAMMMISYLMGRKYYRIKYQLKRIWFYILFALGLFFLSDQLIMPNLSTTSTLLANSIILLFYVNVVYRIEGRILPIDSK